MEEDDNKELVLADLKQELNSFLWTKLPGSMTLQQAEDVSLDIMQIIHKAWE